MSVWLGPTQANFELFLGNVNHGACSTRKSMPSILPGVQLLFGNNDVFPQPLSCNWRMWNSAPAKSLFCLTKLSGRALPEIPGEKLHMGSMDMAACKLTNRCRKVERDVLLSAKRSWTQWKTEVQFQLIDLKRKNRNPTKLKAAWRPLSKYRGREPWNRAVTQELSTKLPGQNDDHLAIYDCHAEISCVGLFMADIFSQRRLWNWNRDA